MDTQFFYPFNSWFNQVVKSDVLLSVLVTCFNREKYIAEAIESILSSSFQTFEVIIVDDCSTDQSLNIAKKYAAKNDRIHIYQNDNNLGQFANRNKAASLANGTFIKYLDSDDTLNETALEDMINAMQYLPLAGMLLEFNNCSSLPVGKSFPVTLTPTEAYLWHFENGGLLFPGPSRALYLKEKFDEAGGFNEKTGTNADAELHLKLAAVSNTVICRDGLVNWRRHEEQVAAEQDRNEPLMMKERLAIHRQMLAMASCPLNDKEKRRIRLSLQVMYLRRALINYFRKGDFKQFFKLLHPSYVGWYKLPIALLPLRFLRRYWN